MATYAIGDIQGCYKSLKKLLTKIKFDTEKDTLWFCGDLVNRGPDSLKTLQFIRSLGDSAKCVLGNHDLHLMAIYYADAKHRKSDTLKEILSSPEVDDIMNWLRQQPLFHFDIQLNFAMVHAGIYPGWSIEECMSYAKEVEDVLKGDKHKAYFKAMYGNKPNVWQSDLKGMDRLRFITNVFSRLRYVDEKGQLDLEENCNPIHQTNPSLLPWFEYPNKQIKHNRVLFGHWSSLASEQYENCYALDSGCLWGGSLTALKISNTTPKWYRKSCS